VEGDRPDRRRKLFGEVAVEQGLVEREEVMEALRLQLRENMKKEGQERPIGLIMAQMGLITRSQIAEILKNQI